METLRIGLWGCGNHGRGLARALTTTEEAELCAGYDIEPAAMQRLSDEVGAVAVDSADELLEDQDLDGVIIALPTDLHASAAIDAAHAGLHVFLEKPMALTVDECQSVIQAAEDGDLALMVGHVLRYYEPYRTILRKQRAGVLGELFAASFWRFGDAQHRHPHDKWRDSLARSGGFFMEVGAHELDMLRCLLGQPQTLSAIWQKRMTREDEMEDHLSVQIGFSTGTGLFETGKGHFGGQYGFRLMFDQTTLYSPKAFDRHALVVTRANGVTESWEEDFSDEHPVQAELRDWLAACRGEQPVTIPGSDGLATIATAEAIRQSIATGEIVQVA